MKILESISHVIVFITSLAALSLVVLIFSKEYNKRQFHECEITFDASVVTLPCEYVDGIVKIKL